MPAWTRQKGHEYRYYTCAKKVKTGYKKCELPSIPAGELEGIVVDQLRSLLKHPDVIAHTFREVCAKGGKTENWPLSPDLTNYAVVATRRNKRSGSCWG